jgi:adenylate cyclase
MDAATFWNRMVRLSWQGPASGAASALFCLLLTTIPAIGGLERWFSDGFLAWRGKRLSPTKIVIIGVDDQSLLKLRKPLRNISPELAEIVAFLQAEGAVAIGIDMIVPEDLTGRAEFERYAEGDATRLGEAIKQAGNVVLPQWQVEGEWQRTIRPWRFKHDLDPAPWDIGFVNNTEDDDYFLRRQQLYVRDKDSALPHFALAMLQCGRKTEVGWRDGHLLIGGREIPLDHEQRLQVNFRGPPGSFDTVSFNHVLETARTNGRLSPNVAGAFVLIGVTARTQRDYHATPYANNFFRYLFHGEPGLMSGSEWHANVLATLADEAYFRFLPPILSAVLVMLVGIVLGWVYARFTLPWGLAVALLFHFAWKAICASALSYANLQLPVLPMLLTAAVAFAATFAVRWRRIRAILAVLKSEEVANLVGETSTATIGAEELVISVLFADIRNFTTFSESHSPQQVVDLLNSYFKTVIPAIEKNGGVVNQFIGDGLMVIFGAPVGRPDHALCAIRTGMEMIRGVNANHNTWSSLGFVDMRIGIGVHSGPVIVGLVGSENRRDYTAIGDTVNTAARIESMNKELGTELLISEESLRNLNSEQRDTFGIKKQPFTVKVKGKTQELHLFTVGKRA